MAHLHTTLDRSSAATAWSTISDVAASSLHVRPRFRLEDGRTVVIVRELVDGRGTVHASVTDLTCTCPDARTARLWLKAIDEFDDDPLVTSAILSLLGTERFAERIDAVATALEQRMVASEQAAVAAAEEDARLAGVIEVRLKGERRDSRIELKRGNAPKPFWTIHFTEAWERDRFWDWLQWQRHRFSEFAELLEASDALALRSRLLREMLETEQLARRSKLTTTGRRPLRFWCGEVA